MVEALEKLKHDEQKAGALVADLAQKLQEAKNAAREQKMAASQKARSSLGAGAPQEAAGSEPEPKFELNEEEWVYKGDPNDRKAREGAEEHIPSRAAFVFLCLKSGLLLRRTCRRGALHANPLSLSPPPHPRARR